MMAPMSSASGSGDSSVELGRGSMMGVVEISDEAGTVGGGVEDSAEGADSKAGEGALSLGPGMAASAGGFSGSWTVAGGFSVFAKSGSVTHGALCKGVEDRRCSLLELIMSPLPRSAMGSAGKGVAE